MIQDFLSEDTCRFGIASGLIQECFSHLVYYGPQAVVGVAKYLGWT